MFNGPIDGTRWVKSKRPFVCYSKKSGVQGLHSTVYQACVRLGALLHQGFSLDDAQIYGWSGHRWQIIPVGYNGKGIPRFQPSYDESCARVVADLSHREERAGKKYGKTVKHGKVAKSPVQQHTIERVRCAVSDFVCVAA